MTNYLKLWSRNKRIMLLLLVFVAVIVRFYNFQERIIYGPEQAMSLIVSGNYVREKPSLLGQKYFRETTDAHTLFSGAVFNYTLVPLQFLFDHEIAPITAYFTFLNIFTGLTIYLIGKRIFNKSIALLSAFIFLFDPVMIYHSLFLWNYNYLPLVFLLSIYAFYLSVKNKELKYDLILGILSGIGISLQLLYIIPFLVFLGSTLIKRKKLSALILFILGSMFGSLPMVLFDLRHNFYHLKTSVMYFSEVILKGAGGGLSYYHFLYLWVILAFIGGYILYKLYKRNLYLGLLINLVYLILSLSSPLFKLQDSNGMPPGLTAGDIYKAAEIIAVDSRKCASFNVLEVLDFDTRAHVLRYPLIFKYRLKPLDFIDYKNAQCVYSLSGDTYNYTQADFWEINEIKPFRIEKIAEVGNRYIDVKLINGRD